MNFISPMLIAIVALLQTVTYFTYFTLRSGYTDYDDALLVLSMAVVVFFVLILLSRTIENTTANNLLQLGWAIVIIVLVHTGLIQFVDISYPLQEGILTTIIQQFQDNLTFVLGIALIPIMLGIYIWVSEIRSRERLFSSIISAMPVGVSVTNAAGVTVLCNDKLAEILGIHKDVILGSNIWDLLSIDISEDLKTNVNLTEVPVELEISIETPTEPKKFLTVVITAISKDRPISYIVVVSDVTTRRVAENDREKQRRVTDLYSSLLTHDIGNDLQAVLGYIEVASMVLDQDPEKAKVMLSSGQVAGDRMANLIKTFRIEAEQESIELVSMLRNIARETELANLGLKVTLDIDSALEGLRTPGVWLLPKAFENIFRNSAQHAGKTPIVNISVQREDASFVIHIEDDGPGIAEDIRSYIFNRSNPQREGGLGLYLAKQIITACGGVIEIDDNNETRGAAFKIQLPIME